MVWGEAGCCTACVYVCGGQEAADMSEISRSHHVQCTKHTELYLHMQLLFFFKERMIIYIYKYITKTLIPSTVSSVFTVPNVRLQPESGESMRAFGKNNSFGKSLSNSKH